MQKSLFFDIDSIDCRNICIRICRYMSISIYLLISPCQTSLDVISDVNTLLRVKDALHDVKIHL